MCSAPVLLPIVGIGASAGGVGALELFLKNIPLGSGMAFVIVQHLDPTHKDIMVELLQRKTILPVVQITDRMQIEADHVYVTPPNRDLSILHGVLHLLEPASPSGLRLPIDFFFRALAEDQHANSIGVILSGMGSDGTLGLRAIKEKAGAVFVQSLASAKFDGMPRSAIESGFADIVAPAEELAMRIMAYLRHVLYYSTQPNLPLKDASQSSLEKIILLLRTNTGDDFSLNKKNTLYRRIKRRMGLHQLPRISEYYRYLLSQELHNSRAEVQAIREEMQASREELVADKEELQSTNEKLTTSKEEVQSMNEELHTVNRELTAKVDELSRTSDDMNNLLNSTEIATLFLDDQLKVRRFTLPTVNLFQLIPGDVGRRITDLVSKLDYLELAGDCRQVLRSLVVCERQVATRDGHWFSVRIIPYRTQGNYIDGVVITFVYISETKALEAATGEVLAVLETRFTSQTVDLGSAQTPTEVLRKARSFWKNGSRSRRLKYVFYNRGYQGKTEAKDEIR